MPIPSLFRLKWRPFIVWSMAATSVALHAQTHDHGAATPAAPASAPASASPPSPARNAPSQAAASAAAAEASPLQRWREANDTVGQYRRGHVDILRWEQQQGAPAPAAPDTVPSAQPTWGMNDAVLSAIRLRPDLALPAGANLLESAEVRLAVAQSQWQVQRAWIEAVAARQTLAYQRDVLQAAEAGADLAQRMQRVGNWSAARQMREELELWNAQAQWRAAEHRHRSAVEQLWRLAAPRDWSVERLDRALPQRLDALPALDSLGAPDALMPLALQQHPQWPLVVTENERRQAALPSGAIAELERRWNERVDATQGRGPVRWDPRQAVWPHAWDKALEARAEQDRLQRQVQSDVRLAWSAWSTAHRLAQQAQNEVQRLHTALQEETLLRYNGMLASTWDLLAAARARVAGTQAALDAQRTAWLAHVDLLSVVAGLPYRGDGPSANAASTAPSPGH